MTAKETHEKVQDEKARIIGKIIADLSSVGIVKEDRDKVMTRIILDRSLEDMANKTLNILFKDIISEIAKSQKKGVLMDILLKQEADDGYKKD